MYHEFYAKFVGVSILCQIIKKLFPVCPHDFDYESSYQIVRVYSLLFSQFIFSSKYTTALKNSLRVIQMVLKPHYLLLTSVGLP